MSASPTIVFLHGLGLSARAFDPVAARLEGCPVLGVDLPGHGESTGRRPRSVAETADFVIARMQAAPLESYLLVGHSMGGKIASVVASIATSAGLRAPSGLVLLAPSPPTPEPMDDEQRNLMLSWVDGGRPLSTAAARSFLDDNVGRPLDEVDADRVLTDLRATSPAAWRHWLEHGSREDVSGVVGAIELPTVILGGTADPDLGAEAQPRLHAEAYPHAEYVALQGAGHLLTYERRGEVAKRIDALAHATR